MLTHSFALALTLAAIVPSAAPAPSPHFPEGLVRRLVRDLTTVSPPDSVRTRIPISLRIAREDTGSALTWRTVFNADTVRGLRDYRPSSVTRPGAGTQPTNATRSCSTSRSSRVR